MNGIVVRDCCVEDAAALVGIYAPYVRDTAITFEYDVPTVEEFRSRICNVQEKYPFLVAECDGSIAGYAYANVLKGRAAYRFSVELSVYVSQGFRRMGVGKRLYDTLESELKEQGITNLYACISWIDVPNRYLTHQSVKFHEALGVERCAHLRKCGYKFGEWFDVVWLEKIIGEHC